MAPTATHPALAELSRARDLTDALFDEVGADAWFERPIPERHRIVFYLGHLEAFEWRQIAHEGLGLPPLSPPLDDLFAFGIDPPKGQLPNDRASDWPSVGETRAYGARVRERLEPLLHEAPDEVLQMAVEHRLMHAETFSYMLHNLSLERRRSRRPPISPPGPGPALEMVPVPGGRVTLGKRRGEGFGWDNEFEAQEVRVPDLLVGRFKVTNGQYLAFVEEGGPVPFYWAGGPGSWLGRGYFGLEPLALDRPVLVTKREADAFASWSGRRLLSEAEYHRAAFGTLEGQEREFPWGDEAPSPVRGNFDFRSRDLEPVTAHPRGASAFGVEELVGNGWEWTSSLFRPFPGFVPHRGYPGYSAPFFDDSHFVLKGASPSTDRRLVRRSFRNWFREDYPYMYGTFRLVED
jgi:formylglycine-generating enzyme required for sulfatase activity